MNLDTGFGKSLLRIISDDGTHQANNYRERLPAWLSCESTGKLIRTDFDFLRGKLAFSGVSRVLLLVLIGVDVVALAIFLTIGPSFESSGHMGLRHESLLSLMQNLASTAIQLHSKFLSKQQQSNFSVTRV